MPDSQVQGHPDRLDQSEGGLITVDSVETDGSTLTCRLGATGPVSRFLSDEPLKVDYGQPVTDVPESHLVVPPLAQVCPVAWATGADVAVDRLDPDFLVSLHRVQRALTRLYPSFMEGGEIHYDEASCPGSCGEGNPEVADSGESALLFSGGVDSLASYVRHRNEDPTLVSIQGWVLQDSDEWERARQNVETFADRHGCETAFIRSNMLSVLDTAMLNAHYKPHIEGSWYSAVGHGLGLLGLCAPLCSQRGIDTLYIAATHSHSFTEPWGSHPTIDNNVRWSGTTAIHDGYELTRQQKVERIAQFIREEDPELTIRTCTHADGAGGNCSQCEKCYRTIVGLVIAGIDPRNHGYAVTAETFPSIREGFESGEWVLSADERFMWEDLQAAAPQESPLDFHGADEFFAWLADADIAVLVEQANPPLRDRVLRGIARNSPYSVYRSLYPLYRRVQQTLLR